MKIVPSVADLNARWSWLRFPFAAAGLVWVTLASIRWAMLPGWWMGSWLQSDGTFVQRARDRFGPILLQTHWISDPPGVWRDEDEVFRVWGQYETVCRLQLIVWVFCGIACIWILKRMRRGPTMQSSVPGSRGTPAAVAPGAPRDPVR
jgi:hypothetical protein